MEAPHTSEMGSETAKGNSQPELMNLNDYKAGMEGLNKDRINQIIHNVSKGSSYHHFQINRQKRIDSQIQDMLKKRSSMTETQRMAALIEADKLACLLEERRVLTRIIVHIDMDMFFAAVEIRDNPELKDKPVAVGGNMMISTSNYVARQYGVRAAMPGFVAKQLCPELVVVKCNYKKYTKESDAVFSVLKQYDPCLTSMSLDEAYLDITDYVENLYVQKSLSQSSGDEASDDISVLPLDMWNLAEKVVTEMRNKIFTETQLTASAGISCNAMLAKVCTDIKKPNGQFMLIGRIDTVKEFIANTPVRKINGIGPVSGQYLNALDIKTCEDLWKKRDLIQHLFSSISSKHYIKVSLGIGSTMIRSDDSRKSKSCERTFGELSDVNEILSKIRELCQRIASELSEDNFKGKTVSLKLKKTSFEVILKSRSLTNYTSDSEVIFETAKTLLQNELALMKPEESKFRLIGVKISNFQDDDHVKDQHTLSGLFKKFNANKNNETLDANDNDTTVSTDQLNDDSGIFECSVCSEGFDQKLLLESHEQHCLENLFNNSKDTDASSLIPHENCTEISSNAIEIAFEDELNSNLLCPICLRTNYKSLEDLNQHIDLCLNMDICRELTQIPSSNSQSLNMNMPNMNMPNIHMPNIHMPNIHVPKHKKSERKEITEKRRKIEKTFPNKNFSHSLSSQKRIEHFFSQKKESQ